MADHATLEPSEARQLLENVERLGTDAHRAVRLPYIAFLLTLGVATALGTFAMTLTTGRAYSAILMGMVAVVVFLIIGFAIAVQNHLAFSYSRRWCAYIAAWFVPYAVAIATIVWLPDADVFSAVASAAILLATSACAVWEARS
ncbi:chemotaxis protein CheY [Paramicrobacterium fandaimingii]|uniref:chemotaxis protein CheY n=1 Tax=Paramicrobacterium fandaimingii TaxID=2708079 RepID=UPI00141F5EBC|nr:chemotaxis protein CheY [Microbacterium fandaimingii]